MVAVRVGRLVGVAVAVPAVAGGDADIDVWRGVEVGDRLDGQDGLGAGCVVGRRAVVVAGPQPRNAASEPMIARVTAVRGSTDMARATCATAR